MRLQLSPAPSSDGGNEAAADGAGDASEDLNLAPSETGPTTSCMLDQSQGGMDPVFLCVQKAALAEQLAHGFTAKNDAGATFSSWSAQTDIPDDGDGARPLTTSTTTSRSPSRWRTST